MLETFKLPIICTFIPIFQTFVGLEIEVDVFSFLRVVDHFEQDTVNRQLVCNISK